MSGIRHHWEVKRLGPSSAFVTTQEECQSIHKFLAERTTMWREPFWPLLTIHEQLRVSGSVELRMVARDGRPHDFVATDATSGCTIFATIRGTAEARDPSHPSAAQHILQQARLRKDRFPCIPPYIPILLEL